MIRNWYYVNYLILFLIHLFIFICGHEEDDSVYYTDSWAVHIANDGSGAADDIATKYGFTNLGQVGSLPGYYHFVDRQKRQRRYRRGVSTMEMLLADDKVKWVEQQKVLERDKRSILPDYIGVTKPSGVTVSDPLFKDQWYLDNIGQSSGPPGVDVNVLPVWARGITGKNVVVAILDDGVDHSHPDLIHNYDSRASYDFNDYDEDPMPRTSDPSNCHGTKCAGEVAAEAGNGICGVGLSFNASIGGIRMLDGNTTDTIEGSALSYHNNYIHIYSCAWGPKDDGKRFGRPGTLASKALELGTQEGRNGLGSVFVWATGNGGLTDDDCNCDGYTTSIYTVSVGAISDHGLSTYYTESCASTLAVTFSGGSHREKKENKIITTTLNHKCTDEFKGTSSAAPLAAGMIALMLEANPRLSWRDVQHVIVETALMTSPLDEGWRRNGAGKWFNQKFGFGRMDAAQMVEKALVWETVSSQKACWSDKNEGPWLLPSSGLVLVSTNTTACTGEPTEIRSLEHVQIVITLKHVHRGHLSIELISPSGTRSQILKTRRNDDSDKGLKDWVFMSVHFWGEDPKGSWTLVVTDNESNNRRHYLDKKHHGDQEDATSNLQDENNHHEEDSNKLDASDSEDFEGQVFSNDPSKSVPPKKTESKVVAAKKVAQKKIKPKDVTKKVTPKKKPKAKQETKKPTVKKISKPQPRKQSKQKAKKVIKKKESKKLKTKKVISITDSENPGKDIGRNPKGTSAVLSPEIVNPDSSPNSGSASPTKTSINKPTNQNKPTNAAAKPTAPRSSDNGGIATNNAEQPHAEQGRPYKEKSKYHPPRDPQNVIQYQLGGSPTEDSTGGTTDRPTMGLYLPESPSVPSYQSVNNANPQQQQQQQQSYVQYHPQQALPQNKTMMTSTSTPTTVTPTTSYPTTATVATTRTTTTKTTATPLKTVATPLPTITTPMTTVSSMVGQVPVPQSSYSTLSQNENRSAYASQQKSVEDLVKNVVIDLLTSLKGSSHNKNNSSFATKLEALRQQLSDTPSSGLNDNDIYNETKHSKTLRNINKLLTSLHSNSTKGNISVHDQDVIQDIFKVFKDIMSSEHDYGSIKSFKDRISNFLGDSSSNETKLIAERLYGELNSDSGARNASEIINDVLSIVSAIFSSDKLNKHRRRNNHGIKLLGNVLNIPGQVSIVLGQSPDNYMLPLSVGGGAANLLGNNNSNSNIEAVRYEHLRVTPLDGSGQQNSTTNATSSKNVSTGISSSPEAKPVLVNNTKEQKLLPEISTANISAPTSKIDSDKLEVSSGSKIDFKPLESVTVGKDISTLSESNLESSDDHDSSDTLTEDTRLPTQVSLDNKDDANIVLKPTPESLASGDKKEMVSGEGSTQPDDSMIDVTVVVDGEEKEKQETPSNNEIHKKVHKKLPKKKTHVIPKTFTFNVDESGANLIAPADSTPQIIGLEKHHAPTRSHIERNRFLKHHRHHHQRHHEFEPELPAPGNDNAHYRSDTNYDGPMPFFSIPIPDRRELNVVPSYIDPFLSLVPEEDSNTDQMPEEERFAEGRQNYVETNDGYHEIERRSPNSIGDDIDKEYQISEPSLDNDASLKPRREIEDETYIYDQDVLTNQENANDIHRQRRETSKEDIQPEIYTLSSKRRRRSLEESADDGTSKDEPHVVKRSAIFSEMVPEPQRKHSLARRLGFKGRHAVYPLRHHRRHHAGFRRSNVPSVVKHVSAEDEKKMADRLVTYLESLRTEDQGGKRSMGQKKKYSLEGAIKKKLSSMKQESSTILNIIERVHGDISTGNAEDLHRLEIELADMEAAGEHLQKRATRAKIEKKNSHKSKVHNTKKKSKSPSKPVKKPSPPQPIVTRSSQNGQNGNWIKNIGKDHSGLLESWTLVFYGT